MGRISKLILVSCKHCGKEFKAKPSLVAVGKSKYCSRECFRQRSVERICHTCGKTFSIYQSKTRESRGLYCSRDCYYESKIGKRTSTDTEFKIGHIPANFKEGNLINSQGYILELCKDHPKANRHGYVQQHRLIVERHIGRYLKNEELIHHIDGNKQNNDISNLYLFESNSSHAKYHLAERTGVIEKITHSNIAA
jgi:hypothetical protein